MRLLLRLLLQRVCTLYRLLFARRSVRVSIAGDNLRNDETKHKHTHTHTHRVKTLQRNAKTKYSCWSTRIGGDDDASFKCMCIYTYIHVYTFFFLQNAFQTHPHRRRGGGDRKTCLFRLELSLTAFLITTGETPRSHFWVCMYMKWSSC